MQNTHHATYNNTTGITHNATYNNTTGIKHNATYNNTTGITHNANIIILLAFNIMQHIISHFTTRRFVNLLYIHVKRLSYKCT